MAHFAEIDDKNIVLRVIVVADEDCLLGGVESEEVGASFCSSLLGGRWVQTSYNRRIRKNFAGIGYSYDEQADAFIPPQPFPSWSINTSSYEWQPPIPRPEEGLWAWDEELLSWTEIDLSTIPSVAE